MRTINTIFLPIIIAAIIVNIYGLFFQSVRLDESQSIWVATKSVPVLLKIEAATGQMPLHTLIMHFWVQIFGTNIVVVRILSLIFFVLTLPFLYWFANTASYRNVALLTVILFTFSPFILWYSNEAGMYTLFTLVVSASHLYFLRMINSDMKTGKLGYWLSTVVGLYTHYFFIFLLLAQMVYVFIKNPKSSGIIYLLIASAFFLFAPWIVYMGQLGGTLYRQGVIPSPTSYNIIQIFFNFIFGFPSASIQTFIISLWPISVMIIFFVFTRREHLYISDPRYFILATFLPIMLVFFISYFQEIFVARYLILITPSLFFLMAWVILNLTKRLYSLLTVTVIGAMFIFMLYQTTSPTTTVQEDYRGVTQYISTYATPDDLVAVTAPFTIYPIEYYYTGYARIITIPPWNPAQDTPIPPFNQAQFINELNTDKKIYIRIFVVFSYDQPYAKTVKNYLDHHFATVQAIKYPANIELRVYRLRYDVSEPPSLTTAGFQYYMSD